MYRYSLRLLLLSITLLCLLLGSACWADYWLRDYYDNGAWWWIDWLFPPPPNLESASDHHWHSGCPRQA